MSDTDIEKVIIKHFDKIKGMEVRKKEIEDNIKNTPYSYTTEHYISNNYMFIELTILTDKINKEKKLFNDMMLELG